MSNEDSSIQLLSTKEFLEETGVDEDGFTMIADRQVEFTGTYLEQSKVDEDSIKTVEIQEIQAEGKHRRSSRNIVLWTVFPLSAVLVIWFMTLITLSGLGKVKFSENFLWGILGAGTLDFLGLCYVITSDLFPQGKSLDRQRNQSEEKASNEEK